MKLEHLIQGYNFNKIPAKIDEETKKENEKAGVIKYYEGITASYLLDNEDMVIAMKLFFNCLTQEDKTLSNQFNHVTKVLNIMQQTIKLLTNVPDKECNIILEKLGLFDNSFQKRKTNKTFRIYL